jgi:signal recognition particle receptor subunit beta
MYVFSVGGSANVRAYWENYLQDTDVLVFVVDSTKDLGTAAIELKKLLGDERLAHAPVLIFAHKQVSLYLDLRLWSSHNCCQGQNLLL